MYQLDHICWSCCSVSQVLHASLLWAIFILALKQLFGLTTLSAQGSFNLSSGCELSQPSYMINVASAKIEKNKCYTDTNTISTLFVHVIYGLFMNQIQVLAFVKDPKDEIEDMLPTRKGSVSQTSYMTGHNVGRN